ncbi:hypothetical protein [Pseudokineococcus sp. 1T1Z-3]|uniref:hypothetical protein n=1 Tax=Pseudokineococcus sp. 1T1Z-3 TaxID=3132745 RepID=UPI0030A1917E
MSVTDDISEARGGTSSAGLSELAQHRSARVRVEVAGNPHADDQTLLALAGDAAPVVRLAAAATGRSRAHGTVRALAASPDWRVREVVAGGEAEKTEASTLPRDVQALLTEDPRWQVRVCIAEHTQHRDLLTRLMADAHLRARKACALNRRLEETDLEVLRADRNGEVRAWVSWSSGLRGWRKSREQWLREAQDRSADVRWTALNHGDVPRWVVETLADDPDETVRTHAQQRSQQGLSRLRTPGTPFPAAAPEAPADP